MLPSMGHILGSILVAHLSPSALDDISIDSHRISRKVVITSPASCCVWIDDYHSPSGEPMQKGQEMGGRVSVSDKGVIS